MIDIYQFYGANEDQGREFGKQLINFGSHTIMKILASEFGVRLLVHTNPLKIHLFTSILPQCGIQILLLLASEFYAL